MKIICIGRNYVDHIAELNNKTPKDPVVFLKSRACRKVQGFVKNGFDRHMF